MFSGVNLTKKILFYMNSDISKFGVLKKIQENLPDVELYGIFDLTDKPRTFFEKQTFVHFKKIWFYHDFIKADSKYEMDYLINFEKKYSISLWDMAYGDRIFLPFNEFYTFKPEQILSILYSGCKFIENIIEEIKPDIYLTSAIHFHHELLLFNICKSKSILPLILRATRFADKAMISEHYEQINYQNHKSVKSRSLQELLSLKENYHIFKKSIIFRDTFLKSKKNLIKAAINFILKNNNSNLKSHYTYFGRKKINVVLNYIYDKIRVFRRKKFIDKTLVRAPTFNENYIFFPLHQEEEYSLLTLAPYYTDQINVIKNIAKSIPIDFKLYVKEHPIQEIRSWRKISTYKELINLPNVKLIHPDVSSTELIKNCKMVITISGTSAFEASFYNKPSIMFSDTMFSGLSWITRLKSFENLNQIISNSFKNKVDVNELNNYVDFIFENSFDHDDDNFSNASQEIFHNGGFLVDNEITNNQMNKFLETFDQQFNLLSKEFLKKILQYFNNKISENIK